MNADVFVMADRIKKMCTDYRAMAVSIDNLSTVITKYKEGTVGREDVVKAIDDCRLHQSGVEKDLPQMVGTFYRLERALYAEN